MVLFTSRFILYLEFTLTCVFQVKLSNKKTQANLTSQMSKKNEFLEQDRYFDVHLTP